MARGGGIAGRGSRRLFGRRREYGEHAARDATLFGPWQVDVPFSRAAFSEQSFLVGILREVEFQQRVVMSVENRDKGLCRHGNTVCNDWARASRIVIGDRMRRLV